MARVLDRSYGLGAHRAWSLNRESVNTVWRVSTSRGEYALKRLGRDVAPQWTAFEHAACPG
ncbi:hypothetical protein GCM10023238_22480 [Streptomyces heliomycini]